MSLVDLIREGRKRAGLTQVELARRAGVPQSTVGRIEIGTRIPSTAMAERLIRAAGFELRVGLGDPDPAIDSLFEQTLRRTPRERLADATRTTGLPRVVAAPSGGNTMAGEDFDPVRMLSALQEASVHFLLVGDMAATLHGDVGVTVDLDVVPERKPANLARLATALRALGARIRTAGELEESPFDCSSAFFRSLALDAILELTTRAGDLDLSFRPDGTGGYADLSRDAIEIEVEDGVRILVASLADVIRSREAVGGEKDRIALPRLRRLLDRTRESKPGKPAVEAP